MKYTVLFADNEDTAREKWGELLREAGYAVRLVATSQEARNKLAESRIDLAVIDMRLENDDLESDVSGLELATDRAFRHIPKIVLTAYQVPHKEQRDLWQTVGGEPPAVVAVVGKGEGPNALLDAIRYAFEAWPRLSMLASKVSEQIKADHDTIRSQARWSFVVSVIMSFLGFIVIVTGLVLAGTNKLAIGLAGSATGIVLEAVGFLFFRRSDLADRRMDTYHRELLQTYGVEFLLSVAERLPAEKENVCIKQTIRAVLDNWYPAGTKSDA